MKKVSLSGSQREGVGKKDAKRLRREGRVPGVLYGGKEQLSFHVADADLEKLIYNPDTHQIALGIDGTDYAWVIQDIQYHPVTDIALHVGMLELFDDQEVTVKLPVRTTGTSIGVKNGGRQLMNFRKLTVRGLPKDLPDLIEVDVSKMKIGDYFRVEDIDLNKARALHSPESVVIAVKRTRMSVDEELALEEDEEEGEEGEEGEGEEGAEGSTEGKEGSSEGEGSEESKD